MWKLLATMVLSMLSGCAVLMLVPAPSARPAHDIPGVLDESTAAIPLDTGAPRDPAVLELGVSTRVIGRIEREALVRAEVWIAGRPGPESRLVRLVPGAWILPEDMYLAPSSNAYCERIDDAK